ncbi:hypothetical protein BYZ73_18690 [Rhodovulum viride]|uniref:Uncharacterized protein n=1 Tax=Rhodovulum viride TaxID=1231134 RepID=A0ABX9DEL9_9RHOB|nr:hypothetical protein [Rhodovulum viride]RAP39783.1 hypothetical protein BYZ73_18690 [Rhodovulum viride]
MSEAQPRPVTIIDRPCRFGKTTRMIADLEEAKQYLIVTPLLTECDRIVRDARVPVMQPEIVEDEPDIATKKDHLVQLLRAQKNVVTTHAMFDHLADVAGEGLLDAYHILIDEVVSVGDSSFRCTEIEWRDFYLKTGYARVDPATGQVIATSLWEDNAEEVSGTLSAKAYRAARSGRLFNVGEGTHISVIPEILRRAGQSLTVFTFKAEGSLMFAHLDRLGLNPVHDSDGPEVERGFVREVRHLIDVQRIPALDRRTVRVKGKPVRLSDCMSYSKQMMTPATSVTLDTEIAKALASLRRGPLASVALPDILVVCPKDKWFEKGREPGKGPDGTETTPFRPGPYADGSRLAPRGTGKDRARSIPNKTQGTNAYRHASHVIYLYDQYPTPLVHRWVGGKDAIDPDDYALIELIQVIWRTRIRDGEPITAYIPNRRMRELFLSWLWEGDVPQSVRNKIASQQGSKPGR